jgi:alpha-galactosidase
LIREEAGADAFIVGCGVPLSPSIGWVDAMRVGPDTGPYWIKRTAKILRTGAMVGARNSIRNTLVRSHMHRRLWLNDPDCLMLRRRGTGLSDPERMSQINAIALSGAMLLYSDDFSRLESDRYEEIDTINRVSRLCFGGRAVPIDLLAKEIPELYYNTAGFLGIFNAHRRRIRRTVDIGSLPDAPHRGRALVDVWSGERFAADESGTVQAPSVKPHGSRLFRVEWDD